MAELTDFQKKSLAGASTYEGAVGTSVFDDAAKNGKQFNTESPEGGFVQKEEMGIIDSIDAGFTYGREEGASLVGTMQRSIDDAYDPNFRFDEEKEAIIKGFEPVFQDFLLEAESDLEWDSRMASVEQTMRNREKLAQSMGDNPVTTIAAMLSAGILSEENAALMAVPIAGQYMAGVNSLSKIGRGIKMAGDVMNGAVKGKTAAGTAMKAGAIGAGLNGAFGAYNAANLPDYHFSDVLVDIVAGGASVGGLGYLGHKLTMDADMVRTKELATAVQQANHTTVNGGRKGHEVDFEELGREKQGNALWGTNWLATKLSDGARLRNSDNPFIRGLARALVQENRVGGEHVNSVAASSHQKRINSSAMTRYAKATRPLYNEWKRKHGQNTGFWDREAKFHEDVNKAIRNDAFYNQAPKEIQQAADGVRPIYQDLLKQKKDAGVKSADNVEYNRNYVPTEWDSTKTRHFTAEDQFGFKQVAHRLIAPAIQKMNPEWDPMLSRKVASMVLRKINNLEVDEQMVSRLGDMFEDLEELKAAMKADGSFSDDEIKAIFSKPKDTSNPTAGKTKDVNLKKRLEMDYDYSVFLKKADGTDVQVTVSDLLNNNAHDLMQMYSFKAGRHIGLALNGIDGVNGKTFEKILKEAEEWNMKHNNGSQDFADEMKILSEIYDVSLRGADFLSTGRNARAALQAGRNLTYLAYSGFFGVSSIIETANTVGYHGFRNLMKAAPALKGILRDARNGKLKSEELNLIEDALGIGSSGYRGQTTSRMDEVGGMFEATQGRIGQIMAKGREKYAKITGLTPITDFSQRLNMALLRQQWLSGDIPKAMRQGTGLDDAMYKRIKAQVKKHNDGRNLGLSKWDDPEARDAFYDHLAIEIRNNTQETDIGATNRFLRSQVGQSLFQFMSFLVGSNEHQAARLAGRMRGDMKVQGAKVIMAQMMLASLMHISRTYATYSGRSDEREKLKEKLSAQGIILGTLNYTGAFGLMSMLAGIPTKVQNIGHGGLGTSTLNNPTVGYLDNISSLAFDLLENGELDERGYRSLLHSLPGFWNLYTVTGMNMIAKELGN